MNIALTTRWNAGRHTDGEAMINEILEMGFDHVELGYDLRLDLVPGVKKMIEQGAVTVNSVHNFCPVPVGAPRGHPELFTLADPDRRVRDGAVQHISRTIAFAAEVGAKVMVVHAGNVKMKHLTPLLIDLAEKERQFTPAYEKAKLKLQVTRDRKSIRQLEYLRDGVQRLLPTLQEHDVRMAFENLPTWEAMPTEMEMQHLVRDIRDDHLMYWHDLGHGQIRENLGLINQERWLERLEPHLAGMHIHDVIPPGMDHVMPPKGGIDFSRYARFGNLDIVRVIEPTPRTSREDIVAAHRFLKEAWFQTNAADDT